MSGLRDALGWGWCLAQLPPLPALGHRVPELPLLACPVLHPQQPGTMLTLPGVHVLSQTIYGDHYCMCQGCSRRMRL